MKPKNKEETLIVIMLIFFLASLIRTEFIAIFIFLLGFILGRQNKTEKWVKLK